MKKGVHQDMDGTHTPYCIVVYVPRLAVTLENLQMILIIKEQLTQPSAQPARRRLLRPSSAIYLIITFAPREKPTPKRRALGKRYCM